jgi:hypothetical protein
LRQVAEQLSRETVLERAAAAAAFPPLAAAVVAPVLLPPPIPASAGADMPAVSATHKAKRINLFILPPALSQLKHNFQITSKPAN